MQIEFGLVVSLDPSTRKFLEQLMSQITDKIAELKQHVDDATTRVQADVSSLKAQISDLTAKVAQGLATPEDLAALDTLMKQVDAIDPTSPAVLPTPPPPA